MPTILSICGSPAPISRTAHVLRAVDALLGCHGFDVVSVQVGALPAEALLHGDAEHPAIVRIADLLRHATGVVIGTPIYKAAYSGIVKSLLDVLPQRAFARKGVLPLATGGSPAHMLALDYALRPVLCAMGAEHIAAGRFILERLVTMHPDGTVTLDVEAGELLTRVTDDFAATLISGQRWASATDRVAATPSG